MTPQLLLLREGDASGEDNMRRDVELLHACADGDIGGAVRLYGFDPPCLSLGRTQPLGDVDAEACARDGIDVVRRPSGGRAVLHAGEVTYAVICRSDDPHFGGSVLVSCARIHVAVARGLALLGAAVVAHAWEGADRARAALAVADCFATPGAHELVTESGVKIVGSAQHRVRGALLQHGSVPVTPPPAWRYVREGRRREGGVSFAAGRVVTRSELEQALAEGFGEVLGARLAAPAGHPAGALDTTR